MNSLDKLGAPARWVLLRIDEAGPEQLPGLIRVALAALLNHAAKTVVAVGHHRAVERVLGGDNLVVGVVKERAGFALGVRCGLQLIEGGFVAIGGDEVQAAGVSAAAHGVLRPGRQAYVRREADRHG